MTTAREIAEAIADEDLLSDDLALAIESALLAERRRAIEEAMKAVCFACAHGWPVEFASIDSVTKGSWRHTAPGAKRPGHWCDANPIRSLASPREENHEPGTPAG